MAMTRDLLLQVLEIIDQGTESMAREYGKSIPDPIERMAWVWEGEDERLMVSRSGRLVTEAVHGAED